MHILRLNLSVLKLYSEVCFGGVNMQIPAPPHLILIQAMNYLPTGLPRDTCGPRTILLREALS